jgi:hypothetical protein
MQYEAIRILIRQKLAGGTLPNDNIPRFWGGPSDGEECDACDEVILANQLLMEGISTLTSKGIQFHVECFYLWDVERDAPGR